MYAQPLKLPPFVSPHSGCDPHIYQLSRGQSDSLSPALLTSSINNSDIIPKTHCPFSVCRNVSGALPAFTLLCNLFHYLFLPLQALPLPLPFLSICFKNIPAFEPGTSGICGSPRGSAASPPSNVADALLYIPLQAATVSLVPYFDSNSFFSY